jgi:hypothetical protein
MTEEEFGCTNPVKDFNVVVQEELDSKLDQDWKEVPSDSKSQNDPNNASRQRKSEHASRAVVFS